MWSFFRFLSILLLEIIIIPNPVVVRCTSSINSSITVTNNADISSTYSCHHNCSLRQAWSLCQSLGGHCDIHLEAGIEFYVDTHQLGSFEWSQLSNRTISIIGNGATIVDTQKDVQLVKIPPIELYIYPPVFGNTTFHACNGDALILSFLYPADIGKDFTLLNADTFDSMKISWNREHDVDVFHHILNYSSISMKSCFDFMIYGTCNMTYVQYYALLEGYVAPKASSGFIHIQDQSHGSLHFSNLTFDGFRSYQSNGGSIIGSEGRHHLNITLDNIRINDTSAIRGGAIYSTGDSLQLTNVYINSSTAILHGGCIYAINQTVVRIHGSVFEAPSVLYGKGSVICGYQLGDVEISNFTVISSSGASQSLVDVTSSQKVDISNADFSFGRGGLVFSNINFASIRNVYYYNQDFASLILSNTSDIIVEGIVWQNSVNAVFQCSHVDLIKAEQVIFLDSSCQSSYCISVRFVRELKVNTLQVMRASGGVSISHGKDVAVSNVLLENNAGTGLKVNNCAFLMIYGMNCVSSGPIVMEYVEGGSVSMVDLQNGISFSSSGLQLDHVTNMAVSKVTLTGLPQASSWIAALSLTTFSNSTLDDITCVDWKLFYNNGACIRGDYLSYVNITNITAMNSEAIGGWGSDFLCAGCSYVSLSSLVSNGAKADSGGGSIVVQQSDHIVLQDIAIYNSQCGESGGGIFIDNAHNLEMIGLTCNGCSSRLDGGGIAIVGHSSEIAFVDLHLENCWSAGSGGGIFFDSSLGGNILFRTFEQYQDTKALKLKGGDAFPANFPSAETLLIYFPSTLDVAQDGSCSISIYDGFDNEIGYYFPKFGMLPGYNTVPKIAHISNLTIQVAPSCGTIDLNIVPMYDTKWSAVFTNNTALIDGGGILLASDSPPVFILNALFKSNQAGHDGGAMKFKAGNSRILFAQSEILDNIALQDGGGIYFGASNYAIHMVNCIVSNNTAFENGGGLYFLSYNGIIVRLFDSTIKVLDSVISSNQAQSNGGGIFLKIENTVNIGNCLIVDNSAVSNHGGGVYLESRNTLSVTDSTFRGNLANGGSGGAVIADSHGNTVGMTQVAVLSNAAGNGGGVSMFGNSKLTFTTNVHFEGNIAKYSGGAISVISSPLWSIGDSDVIVSFIKNRAERGSAIFMHALTSSNNTFDASYYLDFQGNYASKGPTIFWVYDRNLMTQPPALFGSQTVNPLVRRIAMTSNIHSANNYEGYGDLIATQPISLELSQDQFVSAYNDEYVTTTVEVIVRDFYSNLISKDAGLSVVALIGSSRCLETSRPYIYGSDASASGVSIIDGKAEFQDIRGACFPEGSISINLTLYQEPLQGLVTSDRETYSLFRPIEMKFRQCRPGEYISNGMCETCSKGEYSLIFNDTRQCDSCYQVTGVEKCVGNTLTLINGYYRRNYTSKAVISCYGGGGCCGGPYAGEDSCCGGYTGPLCSACVEGYYKSGLRCVRCSEGSKFPAEYIALIVLGSLALIAFIFFLEWMRHDENDESNSWISRIISYLKGYVGDNSTLMTKLKIIVATYQVALASASIFNVAMPGRFTAFARIFAFVNLDAFTLFPVGCSYKVNFMDKLVWMTLAPIVVIGILYLLLWFEIWRAKHDHMHLRLQCRYLSLIFYVTYLVLPSVTTVIFQLYNCVSVDPHNEDDNHYDNFLLADVTIACHTDYYRNWLVYGYLMILVYPIGTLVFYLVCVIKTRPHLWERILKATGYSTSEEKNTNIPNVVRTNTISATLAKIAKALSFDYSLTPLETATLFLTAAYKDEYCYWEVIEVARRILLTAVLSVCATGTIQQQIFGLLLSFGFILVYNWIDPYELRSDYNLAQVGLIQIFLTYFATIVISANFMGMEWFTAIGIIMILVNLLVIVIGLLLEFIRQRKEREANNSQLPADDSVSDNQEDDSLPSDDSVSDNQKDDSPASVSVSDKSTVDPAEDHDKFLALMISMERADNDNNSQ